MRPFVIRLSASASPLASAPWAHPPCSRILVSYQRQPCASLSLDRQCARDAPRRGFGVAIRPRGVPLSAGQVNVAAAASALAPPQPRLTAASAVATADRRPSPSALKQLDDGSGGGSSSSYRRLVQTSRASYRRCIDLLRGGAGGPSFAASALAAVRLVSADVDALADATARFERECASQYSAAGGSAAGGGAWAECVGASQLVWACSEASLLQVAARNIAASCEKLLSLEDVHHHGSRGRQSSQQPRRSDSPFFNNAAVEVTPIDALLRQRPCSAGDGEKVVRVAAGLVDSRSTLPVQQQHTLLSGDALLVWLERVAADATSSFLVRVAGAVAMVVSRGGTNVETGVSASPSLPPSASFFPVAGSADGEEQSSSLVGAVDCVVHLSLRLLAASPDGSDVLLNSLPRAAWLPSAAGVLGVGSDGDSMLRSVKKEDGGPRVSDRTAKVAAAAAASSFSFVAPPLSWQACSERISADVTAQAIFNVCDRVGYGWNSLILRRRQLGELEKAIETHKRGTAHVQSLMKVLYRLASPAAADSDDAGRGEGGEGRIETQAHTALPISRVDARSSADASRAARPLVGGTMAKRKLGSDDGDAPLPPSSAFILNLRSLRKDDASLLASSRGRTGLASGSLPSIPLIPNGGAWRISDEDRRALIRLHKRCTLLISLLYPLGQIAAARGSGPLGGRPAGWKQVGDGKNATSQKAWQLGETLTRSSSPPEGAVMMWNAASNAHDPDVDAAAAAAAEKTHFASPSFGHHAGLAALRPGAPPSTSLSTDEGGAFSDTALSDVDEGAAALEEEDGETPAGSVAPSLGSSSWGGGNVAAAAAAAPLFILSPGIHFFSSPIAPAAPTGSNKRAPLRAPPTPTSPAAWRAFLHNVEFAIADAALQGLRLPSATGRLMLGLYRAAAVETAQLPPPAAASPLLTRPEGDGGAIRAAAAWPLALPAAPSALAREARPHPILRQYDVRQFGDSHNGFLHAAAMWLLRLKETIPDAELDARMLCSVLLELSLRATSRLPSVGDGRDPPPAQQQWFSSGWHSTRSSSASKTPPPPPPLPSLHQVALIVQTAAKLRPPHDNLSLRLCESLRALPSGLAPSDKNGTPSVATTLSSNALGEVILVKGSAKGASRGMRSSVGEGASVAASGKATAVVEPQVEHVRGLLAACGIELSATESLPLYQFGALSYINYRADDTLRLLDLLSQCIAVMEAAFETQQTGASLGKASVPNMPPLSPRANACEWTTSAMSEPLPSEDLMADLLESCRGAIERRVADLESVVNGARALGILPDAFVAPLVLLLRKRIAAALSPPR